MKKDWIKPDVEMISVCGTQGPGSQGNPDSLGGKTHPVFPSGKPPKAYEIGL